MNVVLYCADPCKTLSSSYSLRDTTPVLVGYRLAWHILLSFRNVVVNTDSGYQSNKVLFTEYLNTLLRLLLNETEICQFQQWPDYVNVHGTQCWTSGKRLWSLDSERRQSKHSPQPFPHPLPEPVTGTTGAGNRQGRYRQIGRPTGTEGSLDVIVLHVPVAAMKWLNEQIFLEKQNYSVMDSEPAPSVTEHWLGKQWSHPQHTHTFAQPDLQLSFDPWGPVKSEYTKRNHSPEGWGPDRHPVWSLRVNMKL